jgi:hypothetical protein
MRRSGCRQIGAGRRRNSPRRGEGVSGKTFAPAQLQWVALSERYYVGQTIRRRTFC